MDSILKNSSNYFFIGIGGTGMSALAQYLKFSGYKVSGSDRDFNSLNKLLIQKQLEQQHIECFPQDGSGINTSVDVVIVSTAIEETNLEYSKAKKLGIPIVKRSNLLAFISKSKRTIAIGGTSGKSTTTAMTFHALEECGFSPSLITGAGLVSLQKKGLPGNAWYGKGDWLVIEADESDGSIVNYFPEIAVVLNIERDHKEIPELIELFTIFKSHTAKQFIINGDAPLLASLSANDSYNFGGASTVGFKGANFHQEGFTIHFTVNEKPVKLPAPGIHNMENAMAAIAVCVAAGAKLLEVTEALASYPGIYRRTQKVGEKNSVIVVDDFAHNPSEVVAAIKSCQTIGNRVIAWFQPHGYGPLRFMKDDLIHDLEYCLNENDVYIMSEVYYAGGTVEKNISSSYVIDGLKNKKKNAIFIPDKAELLKYIKLNILPGDVILLMGARDPLLADFAQEVFHSVQ